MPIESFLLPALSLKLLPDQQNEGEALTIYRRCDFLHDMLLAVADHCDNRYICAAHLPAIWILLILAHFYQHRCGGHYAD